MKMVKIDLKRIREALPNHATVSIKKDNSVIRLVCWVPCRTLSESDFEMVKNWQRDIIGKENISEFFTEETGRHWIIYLKRIPLEFINLQEGDIDSYTGMELEKTAKN
jgi:hypothetical protein